MCKRCRGPRGIGPARPFVRGQSSVPGRRAGKQPSRCRAEAAGWMDGRAGGQTAREPRPDPPLPAEAPAPAAAVAQAQGPRFCTQAHETCQAGRAEGPRGTATAAFTPPRVTPRRGSLSAHPARAASLAHGPAAIAPPPERRARPAGAQLTQDAGGRSPASSARAVTAPRLRLLGEALGQATALQKWQQGQLCGGCTGCRLGPHHFPFLELQPSSAFPGLRGTQAGRAQLPGPLDPLGQEGVELPPGKAQPRRAHAQPRKEWTRDRRLPQAASCSVRRKTTRCLPVKRRVHGTAVPERAVTTRPSAGSRAGGAPWLPRYKPCSPDAPELAAGFWAPAETSPGATRK